MAKRKSVSIPYVIASNVIIGDGGEVVKLERIGENKYRWGKYVGPLYAVRNDSEHELFYKKYTRITKPSDVLAAIRGMETAVVTALSNVEWGDYD